METKKSVRRGIIKQAILTLLLALYVTLMFWGGAEKPIPLDVRLFLTLMFFGLPCLVVLSSVIKNYRNPKIENYSSTLKLDGDFLVVRNPIKGNCRDEKRIPLSKVKCIELSGRRFVARLKGIGLDFGTTFDTADKEQLRATVEQIGKQSGIEIKT